MKNSLNPKHFQIRLSHVLTGLIVLSVAFATLELICQTNREVAANFSNNGFHFRRGGLKSVGNWPQQMSALQFGAWGLGMGAVYLSPIYLLAWSRKPFELQRFLTFAGPCIWFFIGNLPVFVAVFARNAAVQREISALSPFFITVLAALATFFAMLYFLKHETISLRRLVATIFYQLSCWALVIVFLRKSIFLN